MGAREHEFGGEMPAHFPFDRQAVHVLRRPRLSDGGVRRQQGHDCATEEDDVFAQVAQAMRDGLHPLEVLAHEASPESICFSNLAAMPRSRAAPPRMASNSASAS